MVPIGRLRACGSPSKRDSPRRSAATGGTKRMTVPARPQSIAVSAAAASMLIGSDLQVGAEGAVAGHFRDGGPQLPQGLNHQRGIPGVQGSPQPGRSVREGGKHEVPVGQGLGSGNGDSGIDRPGGEGGGPVRTGVGLDGRRQGGTGQLQRGWCQSLPS